MANHQPVPVVIAWVRVRQRDRHTHTHMQAGGRVTYIGLGFRDMVKFRITGIIVCV